MLVAKNIRDLIITILGANLGQYTTPIGTIAAARIFDRRLPPDWTMAAASTGLEFIIPLNPERVSQSGNIGRQYLINRWDCKIILHRQDFAVQPVLDNLADCLHRQDLRVSYIRMPGSDMVSEQYIVSIEQSGTLQNT